MTSFLSIILIWTIKLIVLIIFLDINKKKIILDLNFHVKQFKYLFIQTHTNGYFFRNLVPPKKVVHFLFFLEQQNKTFLKFLKG